MAHQTAKDKIIDAAERVFWERGFHGATIDDVISAAGTTPRTLYRHFVSKQALAAATIVARSDRFHGWYAQRISELMENGDDLPRSAVIAMAEWVRKHEFGGCFFLRGHADYRYGDAEIARIALNEKERIRDVLLQTARRSGALTNTIMLERLYFILEGLIASSQSMKSDAALKVALFLASSLRESER